MEVDVFQTKNRGILFHLIAVYVHLTLCRPVECSTKSDTVKSGRSIVYTDGPQVMIFKLYCIFFSEDPTVGTLMKCRVGHCLSTYLFTSYPSSLQRVYYGMQITCLFSFKKSNANFRFWLVDTSCLGSRSVAYCFCVTVTSSLFKMVCLVLSNRL